MSSKSGPNMDGQGTARTATMDECVAALRAVLLVGVGLDQTRGKQELDEGWRWEFWRLCRHIATEPGNRLAGLLAGPAMAVIPMINDLLRKTEAGVRSQALSAEQRKEMAKFAEQLDFALALIHRNLGFLISSRGQSTSSSDLFCEAWSIAKGDSSQAARLIRRCREHFPENVTAESDNIVDEFAWETYQRVETLDRFADEFPDQVATAGPHMHGWPMIRQRHHDNRARFETLAERFKLGADYPLDASKHARFRADTPMVRYLDVLVCRLDYLRGITHAKHYTSVEEEKESLRIWWWDCSDERTNDAVLDVLCVARKLPRLTKHTATQWAKRAVVPLILVTDGSDWANCKEKALQQVARQRGVKSLATFKSRLLAAVTPTLRSMARSR